MQDDHDGGIERETNGGNLWIHGEPVGHVGFHSAHGAQSDQSD